MSSFQKRLARLEADQQATKPKGPFSAPLYRTHIEKAFIDGALYFDEQGRCCVSDKGDEYRGFYVILSLLVDGERQDNPGLYIPTSTVALKWIFAGLGSNWTSGSEFKRHYETLVQIITAQIGVVTPEELYRLLGQRLAELERETVLESSTYGL